MKYLLVVVALVVLLSMVSVAQAADIPDFLAQGAKGIASGITLTETIGGARVVGNNLHQTISLAGTPIYLNGNRLGIVAGNMSVTLDYVYDPQILTSNTDFYGGVALRARYKMVALTAGEGLVDTKVSSNHLAWFTSVSWNFAFR
jgi:hypothetical protein